MNHYYSIIDSAVAENRIEAFKERCIKHQSLFSGNMAELLNSVAPVLFEYAINSNFEYQYNSDGLASAMGVFIESTWDFEKVYNHLRKFLYINTESGEKLYFRFYDPRVLPDFLKNAGTAHLTEFLPSYMGYKITDKDGTISYFSQKEGKLSIRKKEGHGD